MKVQLISGEVKKIEQLKNNFLREVGTLTRAIHYINDISFRKLHLQKGQFVFVTRICENEGIHFTQLSELLKVDKTTTTKAVNKLIEAGYIFKIQNKEDKREYQLFPTEKGKELYHFIIEEENKNIELCFKGLSKEEIEQACTIVKKMSQNYESQWNTIKNRRKKDDTFSK